MYKSIDATFNNNNKITGSTLLLPSIICDFIFCMRAKHVIGHFVGFSMGSISLSQKSLGPSKNPLDMADNVFCPHKKITFRTIRIGDTLVVKIYFDVIQCLYDTNIYKNIQSRF
jgi:hypothetical protein